MNQPRYTIYKTRTPIVIDGKLNGKIWDKAPWSDRFIDLISGEPVIFDVNTHDHAHICDADTRTVRDFDDSELLALVRDYLEEHPVEGLDLQRVDINLIGCDHCPEEMPQ